MVGDERSCESAEWRYVATGVDEPSVCHGGEEPASASLGCDVGEVIVTVEWPWVSTVVWVPSADGWVTDTMVSSGAGERWLGEGADVSSVCVD